MIKSAMKRNIQRIAEQFREAVLYRTMIQNARMLKEKLVVIGSSWVQLERVNPRPSPTLSDQESEWAKAEVVLKSGNLVFERNQIDSG
ncbi:hypothetical protein H5410_022294 [Solanum commersonii]|uniref:Uncharacterized protein n=1 Tax=Solanum commersonii TaxID=4109 RepID=A0A9J5ZF15_SOLCO|nr:hypothetical protein H5410_022294 [Solanum commersonii]